MRHVTTYLPGIVCCETGHGKSALSVNHEPAFHGSVLGKRSLKRVLAWTEDTEDAATDSTTTNMFHKFLRSVLHEFGSSESALKHWTQTIFSEQWAK